MLNKKTVEGVANLARLKLNDLEVEELSSVLSKVLAQFEEIAKVDTEGVAPLVTPVDIMKSLRPDVVGPKEDGDKLIAGAPEKSGRLYKVPPVV